MSTTVQRILRVDISHICEAKRRLAKVRWVMRFSGLGVAALLSLVIVIIWPEFSGAHYILTIVLAAVLVPCLLLVVGEVLIGLGSIRTANIAFGASLVTAVLLSLACVSRPYLLFPALPTWWPTYHLYKARRLVRALTSYSNVQLGIENENILSGHRPFLSVISLRATFAYVIWNTLAYLYAVFGIGVTIVVFAVLVFFSMLTSKVPLIFLWPILALAYLLHRVWPNSVFSSVVMAFARYDPGPTVYAQGRSSG